MISRENFIFTIAYDGATAIIDGKAKARYGAMDTKALAEAGQYRAAFASALYSSSEQDIAALAKIFNAQAGTSYSTQADFARLFGVSRENAKRILVL